MILYIKVEDGKPIDHPVTQANLLDVFGTIPDEYKPFNRTEKPSIGLYEVDDVDAQMYHEVDGTWTDAWPVRPMKAEERAAKEAEVMASLQTSREILIDLANSIMERAKTDNAKNAVADYINQLTNITLSTEEGFIFPSIPVLTADGDIPPPTTAPGSEPEVIG